MISESGRRSSEVLAAPYNEPAVSVHQAEAADIDKASWRRDRRRVRLRVTVTESVAVFTIVGGRAGEAAKALSGSKLRRRIGGGTDGPSGSRPVGRMLSVVATCR